MSLDNPNPIINAKKPTNTVYIPPTSDNGGISPSEIYEYLRDIKDPEHDYTLEQLNVVSEEQIFVEDDERKYHAKYFDHTKYALYKANSVRNVRQSVLKTSIPAQLDIFIKPGTHSTEFEINKQINDKERVAAAMENPNMKVLIEQYINYIRGDY